MTLENRIDSEFFQKEFLLLDSFLKSDKYIEVNDEYKVTDGEHGSVIFQECGIKYLTAENIKSGYIDISNIRYIDEKTNQRNKRAEVNIGDLLISIKGTLGEVAIADNDLLPANMNRDVAILKQKNKSNLTPYLLSAFLMGKYGKTQSLRGGSGGVQQMITLERLRKFIVPNFSTGFNQNISEMYIKALKFLKNSADIYSSAERLLLDTLGLNNSQPNIENINIKSFTTSFKNTGRLDAEYYHLKYEDFYNKIISSPLGYDSFNNIFQVKDSNFTPADKVEYQYIELSDIGKTGDITGCTFAIGSELPTRARRKVQTNDVIISSIEGSLGSCALVTKKYHDAVCSTGFYIIHSKTLNPETTLILFKSQPFQQLLKKGCSGTILTAISRNELEKIPVPLIDKISQQKIAEFVQQSFMLKQKSEQLLETVKHAVEIAIEKDEKDATTYINNKQIS